LIGNTITGFALAIRIDATCDRPSRIAHRMLHRNGIAIEYAPPGPIPTERSMSMDCCQGVGLDRSAGVQRCQHFRLFQPVM
jgi:hypothetical protein